MPHWWPRRPEWNPGASDLRESPSETSPAKLRLGQTPTAVPSAGYEPPSVPVTLRDLGKDRASEVRSVQAILSASSPPRLLKSAGPQESPSPEALCKPQQPGRSRRLRQSRRYRQEWAISSLEPRDAVRR